MDTQTEQETMVQALTAANETNGRLLREAQTLREQVALWRDLAQALGALFTVDNHGRLRLLFNRMHTLPAVQALGDALGLRWGAAEGDG